MRSFDSVILNIVLEFILFNITWIDKWRANTKEEGRKYHMETSIPNSFFSFIFIRQFRLWWNRENLAIIIDSTQFRFWKPLISQSSPDENLSWVTEWAFQFTHMQARNQVGYSKSHPHYLPSSLAATNGLRSQHTALLSYAHSLYGIALWMWDISNTII